MLEHIPGWLGAALKGVRAGAEKLAITQAELAAPASLQLMSPAFADGGRLPERFTQDGEGASPPLVWSGVPAGAASLALLVEDPDAPAPHPLVHAVVWALPADAGRLEEGALGPDRASEGEVGRASFRHQGWLPPDPPTGHGEHRYVFQLFSLGAGAGDPGPDADRAKLVRAMSGQVLAAGVLTGLYSRGTSAATGPDGVVVTA